MKFGSTIELIPPQLKTDLNEVLMKVLRGVDYTKNSLSVFIH